MLVGELLTVDSVSSRMRSGRHAIRAHRTRPGALRYTIVSRIDGKCSQPSGACR